MNKNLESRAVGKAVSTLQKMTITTSVLGANSHNNAPINNPTVIGPTINFHFTIPKDEPPLAFETFVSVIRAHYLKQDRLKNELINPVGEIKIDQIFVNVAIVDNSKQAQKEKKALSAVAPEKSKTEEGKEISNRAGLSSYEEIYGTKESIVLENLFDGKSDVDKLADVHRLLVSGRAGIGKSTLLHFMAYRWAQNKLWQNKFFKVPILLSLKQMSNTNIYRGDNACIAFVVYKNFGFAQAGISLGSVEKLLIEHADKILYLADGFDEVAAVVQQKEDELTEQGNLIRDVLKQEYLLLSTRPYYIDAYCLTQGFKFDRKLENIGFLDNDIDLYIKRFFGDDQVDLANRLINFLKQNMPIRGIAHIPIMLGLICTIWRKHGKDLEKLSHLTMTMLYQMLFIDATTQKSDYEFPAKAFNSATTFCSAVQKQSALCAMAELAFLQMQEKDLIIHSDKIGTVLEKYAQQITEKNLLRQMLDVGLLKAVDDDETKEERKDYYFVHLTFQEYLAAIHWVNLFRSSVPTEHQLACDILQKEKLNLRYEIMWWFVSGLLKENSNALEDFFSQLEGEPKDQFGFASQLIVARCLEECNLAVVPTRKEKIMRGLSHWLDFQVRAFSLSVFDSYMSLCPNVLAQLINDSDVVQLLTSKNEHERYIGKSILGTHRMLPDSVLVQMIQIFRIYKNVRDIRHAITSILSIQMIFSDNIFREISELLDDPDGNIRHSVITILDNITALPDFMVQKLVKLLANGGQDSVWASSILVKQTKLENHIYAQLLTLLCASNKSTREFAVKILSKRSDIPESVVAQMTSLFKTEKGEVKLSVIEAMAGSKKLSDDLILQMVNLLRSHVILLLPQLPENPLFINATVVTQNPQKIYQFNIEGEKKEIIDGNENGQIFAQLELRPNERNEFESGHKSYRDCLSFNRINDLDGLLISKGAEGLYDGQNGRNYHDVIRKTLRDQDVLSEQVLQRLIDVATDINIHLFNRKDAIGILAAQKKLPRAIWQQLIRFLPVAGHDMGGSIVGALSRQEIESENDYAQLILMLESRSFTIGRQASEVIKSQKVVPISVLEKFCDLLLNAQAPEYAHGHVENILSAHRKLPVHLLRKISELLKSKHVHARSRGLEILSQQYELSKEVLAEINALLQDDDWTIRISAAKLVKRLTFLIDPILHQLKSAFSEQPSESEPEKKSQIKELLHRLTQIVIDMDSPSDAAAEYLLNIFLNEKLSTETFTLIKKALRRCSAKQAWTETRQRKLLQLLKPNRKLACSIISKQKELPEAILQEIVALLWEKDGVGDAMKVLSNQTKLPLSILHRIIDFVANKSISDVLREKILRDLDTQKELPDDILQRLGLLLTEHNEKVQYATAKLLSEQKKIPLVCHSQMCVALTDASRTVKMEVVTILSRCVSLTEEVILQMLSYIVQDETIAYSHEMMQALTNQSKLYSSVLIKLGNLLKEQPSYNRLIYTFLQQYSFADLIKKIKLEKVENWEPFIHLLCLKSVVEKVPLCFDGNDLIVKQEALRISFSVEEKNMLALGFDKFILNTSRNKPAAKTRKSQESPVVLQALNALSIHATVQHEVPLPSEETKPSAQAVNQTMGSTLPTNMQVN